MEILIQISLLTFTVIGIAMIIYTKNVIHAAYALCLTLISIAGIYVLLLSELLAVVQIMLYAGGVIILLVFGVMMTNRLRGEKVVSESKNVFLGALISIGLLSIFSYLISNTSFDASSVEATNQIDQIGVSFLTEHVVAFELIAFILLVALVGAAYLAKMASDD